ncbi:MAG TPA: metal ABC transporter permease [Treponema sp.]|nr:metal ABC transporter permease [Treponema sp.]
MQFILELFTDYTIRNVALGTFLLGLGSGAIGTFALLRRQSLLGDAISHAALPGIVLAYILTGQKSPGVLLAGAAVAGLIGTLFIVLVVRHTRIDTDGAQGIVLSVFFGLGLMLLTYIQKLPNSSQAGLDRFLFGQAATIIKSDVMFILRIEIVVFAILFLLWKEFKAATFDPEHLRVLGFSARAVDFVLTGLVVAVIVVGLQSVGVILISALLVVPAAAARQWTNRLSTMVVIAALVGGLAGASGSVVSALGEHLPTGPVIVLILTGAVIFSILFGPQRGVVSRVAQRIRNRQYFAQDRLLVDLYGLAMSHGKADYPHEEQTLVTMDTPAGSVRQGLRALRLRGLTIERPQEGWALTDAGIQAAKNLVEGDKNA